MYKVLSTKLDQLVYQPTKLMMKKFDHIKLDKQISQNLNLIQSQRFTHLIVEQRK
jgi:hypothetical protein